MVPSLDEHARAQAILSALGADGRVEVNDLAHRLEVSTVTIRKDLEALEQQAALRRVRGGAVAARVLDEGSFESRLRSHRAEKVAIARAVADLVHDGDVVALDSSTTSYFLAHRLLERRSLVVVTTSMPTATLFSERSEATVLVPGGVVRRSSRAVVGVLGDVLAGRGRIDKGFVGAHSISAERGLLDMALSEAQTKRYLTEHCDEMYALVDCSKFGSFSLHTAAPIEALSAVYTDQGAEASAVAAVRATGVPVHLAEIVAETS